MASETPLEDLREEATCSICLEFFRDPLMITQCGHSFCRDCLARCWGSISGSVRTARCPQCRQKIQQQRCIRPNRQLRNVTEIAKKLSLQAGKGPEGERGVCERHQEPLKLFCRKDHILICVVCDRSKEHRDHEVIPLEEASQEYKDEIRSHLEILRKRRENVLSIKSETEKESQHLLKQTKTEREKTVAAFRQLREFLEEQETLLLAQVDKVEAEVAREREEHLAGLSRELSSLDKIIQEMEEKLQQPLSELLRDVKSTLQRYEKKVTFEVPVAFAPALKWMLWDICDLSPFLEGIMTQFTDTLEYGLLWQKEDVVLDPDTAHPELILSEDLKSVRCGDKRQDLPDNPERFDVYPYVLGYDGFTAGRHFWEVTVESEDEWIVGVAKKSVRRKGSDSFGPGGGFWGMTKWEAKSNLSSLPPGSLTREPKRVRVSLNGPGGRLAFFDADTADLIFEYTKAPFSGETLLPFICVDGKAQFTFSP